MTQTKKNDNQTLCSLIWLGMYHFNWIPTHCVYFRYKIFHTPNAFKNKPIDLPPQTNVSCWKELLVAEWSFKWQPEVTNSYQANVIKSSKTKIGYMSKWFRFKKSIPLLYLVITNWVKTIGVSASSKGWSLTCCKELPANKSDHQRCEQLKANNFWKLPSHTSPQIACDRWHGGHYPSTQVYYRYQRLWFVFPEPHQGTQCSQRNTQHQIGICFKTLQNVVPGEFQSPGTHPKRC